MDFGDSPAEAEFRQQLRIWLEANNPGLPQYAQPGAYQNQGQQRVIILQPVIERRPA